MEAEGWYYDPYKRHEARWFSDGTPTGLVRDRHQVTHDPLSTDAPPDPPPDPPVPWDGDATAQNGDDLLRADARQQGGAGEGGESEQIDQVARVVFNPGDTAIW
jgi:hypothetical protein